MEFAEVFAWVLICLIPFVGFVIWWAYNLTPEKYYALVKNR